MPVRVFLISDFCLLRKSLEALLGGAPARFALAGAAASYAEAAGGMAEAAPDVILLDIDGCADGALELIGVMHAGSAAKFLLLTRLADSDLQDKAVARKLNISESTLRNHLTSIYEKLGVANRAGLLTYAFRNNLVERLGH